MTLLGQTVNAYGRPRPGMAPGELAFAELLRRVAAVPGIRRIRFTSPHPAFVSDDLIAAYGELEALCPHLHLPVQSGSDRVLGAMNRRYDRKGYVDTIVRLRAARPGIALTTDLIVGFPTETDADFAETLSLMDEVRFTDSFSFKYSERPGTPAARRGLGELAPELSQTRLEQVQARQRELTLAAHRRPARRTGGGPRRRTARTRAPPAQRPRSPEPARELPRRGRAPRRQLRAGRRRRLYAALAARRTNRASRLK